MDEDFFGFFVCIVDGKKVMQQPLRFDDFVLFVPGDPAHVKAFGHGLDNAIMMNMASGLLTAKNGDVNQVFADSVRIMVTITVPSFLKVMTSWRGDLSMLVSFLRANRQSRP